MELHSKMDIPDLQPLVWSIMWKILTLFKAVNMNKGKGNGAGLAWESQSHCFADQYGNLTHTLLEQTQHDYSRGNCRTMSSIIINLE